MISIRFKLIKLNKLQQNLVLNHFLINEEKVILGLCQLIRWAILTNKIKFLTIYDAFNLLNIQGIFNISYIY